jgi:hypothetical protein
MRFDIPIDENKNLMEELIMQRTIILLLSVFFLIGAAFSQENSTDWDQFSVNLVNAFKIPNDGLHKSAMCMIIRYSDKLDVDDAVFDVVKIFRSNTDPKVRQLALVTLHKMQNAWAMDFLRRHHKFENNLMIRKMNCAIVNGYYARINTADTLKVYSLQQ